MTDAAYDLDYALQNLRDAIDYAEQTGEFVAARKWVNEVEKSATVTHVQPKCKRCNDRGYFMIGGDEVRCPDCNMPLEGEHPKSVTFDEYQDLESLAGDNRCPECGSRYYRLSNGKIICRKMCESTRKLNELLVDPNTVLVDPPPSKESPEGSS